MVSYQFVVFDHLTAELLLHHTLSHMPLLLEKKK